MIFLLADPLDSWALCVEQECVRQNRSVCRLEPSRILDEFRLNWRLNRIEDRHSFLIARGGDSGLPLSDLQGVFVRTQLGRLTIPDGCFAEEDQFYVQRELSAALYGWLNALPCPVVNRPVPGRETFNRMGLALCRDALWASGWVMCSQVVLSQLERAVYWFDHWNREVRVQSIGTDLEPVYLRGAKGIEIIGTLLEQGPVVMQLVPAGQRVVAFIAGDAVIGGTWRTAVQDRCLREGIVDATVLPPSVVQVCRRLARACGLLFAEMELVLGADSTVHCLGISASPLFQRSSDLVRRALVQQLVNVLGHSQEVPSRDSAVRPHSRSDSRQSVRPFGRPIG